MVLQVPCVEIRAGMNWLELLLLGCLDNNWMKMDNSGTAIEIQVIKI